MKFTLEMSLDNDAMRHPDNPDAADRFAVSEVLRSVSTQVAVNESSEGIIRDANGNTIGSWSVEEG